MRMQFPTDDGPLDPSWFQPLERIVEQVPDHVPYRFFDLDDFMLMGRVVRPPRPTITLYKHRYTRRYLNLDADGVAYRYSAPADLQRPGRYLRHRSLHPALVALRLFELPQMKAGLEAHLDPGADDQAADRLLDGEGGDRRGHLRVV